MILEIAAGIILAIIVVVTAPLWIGLIILLIVIFFHLAVIALAFYAHPLLGIIVMIAYLIYFLPSLPSRSTESKSGYIEGNTQNKTIEQIQDPMSILPFYERIPARINTFVLGIQPAFTENQKIKKIVKVSENELHIEQVVEKHKNLLKEKKTAQESKARTRRMQKKDAKLDKYQGKLKKCIEKLQCKFDGYDFLEFTFEPSEISISLSAEDEQFKKKYIITTTVDYSSGLAMDSLFEYRVTFKISKTSLEDSSSDSTEYSHVSDVYSTLKKILREDIANYVLAHKA